MVVTWVAPNAQGSTISQYVIELGDAVDADVWIESTANCNGLSQTVIDLTSCSIPMSVFTGDLNYGLDDTINVRVTAINSKGSSLTPSDVSTGTATAKVIP